MDTDRQVTEKYDEVFKGWMKSSPEIHRYVVSQGFGITGLHNMLFFFFKAGYDYCRRHFASANYWVTCRYMVVIYTGKDGLMPAQVYTPHADAVLGILDNTNMMTHAYRYDAGRMDHVLITREELKADVHAQRTH